MINKIGEEKEKYTLEDCSEEDDQGREEYPEDKGFQTCSPTHQPHPHYY